MLALLIAKNQLFSSAIYFELLKKETINLNEETKMAQLPNVFKPSEDHSMTVPADWYLAKIVKSETKKTKDGAGAYLALGFKITAGSKRGMLIWTNLNLVNKNMTTVKIAESDLEAIAAACGQDEDFDDSQVLHGIEIAIKVVIVPASAQWPAKNEIKGYKSAEDADIESDDDDASPFEGFGETSDTSSETDVNEAV